MRWIMAAVLVSLPISANAAWFCGDEPTHFAELRASGLLATVELDERDIIRGRLPMGGASLVCDDKGDCTYRFGDEKPAKLDPAFYTKAVDKYEAMVIAIDDWSVTLSDGCLKDAYHNIADAHRGVISKDRRAIDFLKNSPAPLEPNS